MGFLGLTNFILTSANYESHKFSERVYNTNAIDITNMFITFIQLTEQSLRLWIKSNNLIII